MTMTFFCTAALMPSSTFTRFFITVFSAATSAKISGVDDCIVTHKKKELLTNTIVFETGLMQQMRGTTPT